MNNKIIAEFMGGVMITSDPNCKQISFLRNVKSIKPTETGYYTLSMLMYDTSWDWLMKVVDKINTFEKGIFGVTITGNQTTVEDCYGINRNCCFEYNTGTLENTYNACVEFIKWYKQKK